MSLIESHIEWHIEDSFPISSGFVGLNSPLHVLLCVSLSGTLSGTLRIVFPVSSGFVCLNETHSEE